MRTIRIPHRWMAAIALILGVEMSAYAQLGGLINNAKKAAKSVVQTQASSAVASQTIGGVTPGSYAWELKQVEKAGGWGKYLGFDSTPEGQVAMRYFNMTEEDFGTTNTNYCLKHAYNAVYYSLAMPIRVMKGLKEDVSLSWTEPLSALNRLNRDFDLGIQSALKSGGKSDVPIPQEDADMLIKLRDQVKKAFLEYSGFHEKTDEEKQAEIDASYLREFKRNDYFLNELKDKDYSHPKVIEKLKPLFIEKVQQELAPDKILGTYSANIGWLSILAQERYASLKEKYQAAEERQFRTYYEKGGKYYVIRGGFRQVIDKDDKLERSYEDKTYWPGLEMPVEIPARLIEGKF